LKLYDKQKSLDSISNLLGFNAPTKSEVKNQLDIISDPFAQIRKNHGIETDDETTSSE